MEKKVEKEDFLKWMMFGKSWSSAVAQRGGGGVYLKGVDKSKDEAVKKAVGAAKKVIGASKVSVRAKIEGLLLNQYAKGKVSDVEHFKNIKEVQSLLKACQEKCDANILNTDCLLSHIATAQKLLNVMCKAWWAAGWLDGHEPPHCPIDGMLYTAICDKAKKNTGGSACKAYEEVKKALKALAKKKGRKEFSWTRDLEDDDDKCNYGESNYKEAIEALKKAADEEGKTLAQWELETWQAVQDF